MLATDLDGTLIPLGDNEQNSADLRTLAEELEQSKAEELIARQPPEAQAIIRLLLAKIASWKRSWRSCGGR